MLNNHHFTFWVVNLLNVRPYNCNTENFRLSARYGSLKINAVIGFADDQKTDFSVKFRGLCSITMIVCHII